MTDLDKQEGKSCLLVGFVTRVPRGELLVHLVLMMMMMKQVRMVLKMVMEIMLMLVIDTMAVTFSVSSSSRSSGVRDSRKAQSGCLGAIFNPFRLTLASLLKSRKYICCYFSSTN